VAKRKVDSKLDFRCEGCGSTMTYIKLKSKVRVCRRCGFEKKL